jgi:hypothetical protein
MLRTPPHPLDQADRTERLLAAVRVALVAALTALVLAIAALAYVVSFEAIRAFAIQTAAFRPPRPAWSSSGGICAARAGGRPGMPGPWSQVPRRQRGPQRRPRPRSAQRPAARRPPRSPCWGRWSC